MSIRRSLRTRASRLVAPTFAPAHKARALRVVARSRVLTALYFFFRGSYRREQLAMVSGMAVYFDNEGNGDGPPIYRIKRDVHRLEKGISAPDRRPVFAEDYIGDLVEAVGRAESAVLDADRREILAWASDVLDAYFAVVERTPRISAAATRYAALHTGPRGHRRPRPKSSAPPPVDVEALRALAERRRSVRRFLDKPVDRSMLDEAVFVAAQSPSACNRQAFEFRFYDEPDLARLVADLAPGFDPGDRPPPVMAVIVGKYRAYYRERDMHVIYIDASLAAMALVLALESLGLASCCINWPSIPDVDAHMASALALEPDEEVIMLLAIGYADPTVLSPYSQKAGPESLRSYNRR